MSERSGLGQGSEASDGEIVPSDSLVQSHPRAVPLTIVLKNTANVDLYLKMDWGWTGIIFAYLGDPPNAKSILMFPNPSCMASCDAPPNLLCPVSGRIASLGQSHATILPGGFGEVIWEGLAFAFERRKGPTPNGQQPRQCSIEVEPAPGNYTLKACGFRNLSGKPKYECATSSFTLPLQTPQRVEIEFK